MVGRLILLLSLVFTASAYAAEPPPEPRAVIQSLFPSATVIEDKLPDFPVYPVYQLQELLGYAYVSTDFVTLQGFAGKPITMMIGLDTKGRFTGVEVLHHHEPVFLHGLGEAPLNEFVAQYEGRSLKDQIIVQASSRSSRDTGGQQVYFDGVSKATVSVLIINDTILSSALQVARSKLEGFAQAAPTRARQDYYEPLTWQQLLDRGYVQKRTLSAQEVEAKLGRPLTDYPTDLSPPSGEAFTEIYFAYVNSPMVGRNLLGDQGYKAFQERLNDRGKVIMVMSQGVYSHVSEAFVPGSTPSRIGLNQNELAIEMRDLNWLEPNQQIMAPGAPDMAAMNLFRVGGNAGFNPGSEASFHLDITAPRNHLITDHARFTLPVTFSPDLFEPVEVAPDFNEGQQPVWLGLWKERWWQISLLVAGLTILTVFFARQKTLTRYPRLVHGFRWGFLLFTLFFIGFYAQGQLSVVNIYTLLLALWDGFSLNVFLLDPVIFILWTYTFVTLFIWGRGLFCGWLCPFGALQELTNAAAQRFGVPQVKVPYALHERLWVIKYTLFVAILWLSFYSMTDALVLAEAEPFKTAISMRMMRAWPYLAFVVALLAAGLFIERFYCRYLCPLGAALAIPAKLKIFDWLRRRPQCGRECRLCEQKCTVGAIDPLGRINVNECVLCLRCQVVLNDNQTCPVLKRRARQVA